MAGGFQRMFGGPPGAVLAKLVFMSILVGAGLALLGLTPPDLFRGVKQLFDTVFNLGFDAVREVFRYFVYGAVIVIPIWLILRLLGR